LDSGERVDIPCEASLYWRRVRLSFQLKQGFYDLDAFWSSLGAEEGETAWILGEPDGVVHSHASLVSREEAGFGEGDQEELFPAFLVEIASYRFPLDEHEHAEEPITHQQFFDALRSVVVGEDHVHGVSTVDLFFPAQDVRWRMKLLSDPPEFEEIQSELGRISLGGLTLRFSRSSVGLFEANLAVSPTEHEYLCSLTFLQHFQLDTLEATYSTVLKQAEEFSSAFVIQKVTNGSDD
jgi:hypothetical protein